MYEYRKLNREQQVELVRQRLACGQLPHEPTHPFRDQCLYLLSATCYEHKHRMFSEARRQQVLDLLLKSAEGNGLEIRAWVVLPNHYHLLVSVANFSVLGKLFHSVHGSTACQWNLEDNCRGHKVWYRYTDRAIRSEGHYYTTLNYIHYNPVKHNHAQSPYDWSHSSVHWYLERYGREWLQELWIQYPLRDYGRGWDCTECLFLLQYLIGQNMSELLEIESDYQTESLEMGSLNHGIMQTRIASQLSRDERFTVIIELSLDASKIDLSSFGLKAKDELKPDICAYPNTVKRKRRDMVKMPEMPLLVIEIISPSQSIDSLLAKFDAYFELGVKSCWLVMPSLDIVDVYSQPDQHKSFDMDDTEIIDEVMDIHLPIQKLFEW